MTAKYFSIRQKIGEKCISVNAPIIPIPTGQKKKKCLLPGTGCQDPLIVLCWKQLCPQLTPLGSWRAPSPGGPGKWSPRREPLLPAHAGPAQGAPAAHQALAVRHVLGGPWCFLALFHPVWPPGPVSDGPCPQF